MLPALAVVDVVPITKFEVPLPVPAPIRVLISKPVTPEANVGVPLPLNIPGSANDVTLKL